MLLGAFALAALALASLGIYGVVFYSVNRRVRESGIHMALGATAGAVRMRVFRNTLLLVSIGIGLGMIASLAASSLIVSFLHGVSPLDPLTFAAITVLLILISLMVGYLPARRASRIDPNSACGLSDGRGT